jgi:hypothetical protein
VGRTARPERSQLVGNNGVRPARGSYRAGHQDWGSSFHTSVQPEGTKAAWSGCDPEGSVRASSTGAVCGVTAAQPWQRSASRQVCPRWLRARRISPSHPRCRGCQVQPASRQRQVRRCRGRGAFRAWWARCASTSGRTAPRSAGNAPHKPQHNCGSSGRGRTCTVQIRGGGGAGGLVRAGMVCTPSTVRRGQNRRSSSRAARTVVQISALCVVSLRARQVGQMSALTGQGCAPCDS